MLIKKILIIYILLYSLGHLSCRKFVTIEPSPNLVTAQTLFQDETAATSAVIGEYIQIRATSLGILNGGLSVYSSLSADDIINTIANKTADPFRNNDLLPNNSTITVSFWNNAYRNIYHVNAILKGLLDASNIKPELKSQLIGEMKLIRALYYFYLPKLFGDIPLITSTDYETNQSKPRISYLLVQQQVLEDLIDAKRLLSNSYIGEKRTRPNKWCAAALLARFYLYSGNWDGALKEADSIINFGPYYLESELNKVFLPDSKETLWQLARDIANTSEGSAFVPYASTARPTYVLSDSLLGNFSLLDKRRQWIDSTIYQNKVYYYPAKYKGRGTSPVLEYLVVFRLPEIYLIRSEANLRLHKFQLANQDLNTIRVRAGLSDTTYINEADLFNGIILERRREFFAEWGHRWLDLKRLNLAETILAPIKSPNWQATDTLYPIPQIELDRNPYLTQNPGY